MSASVVELHGDVYIKFAPPGTSKRHSCKSCDKFTPSCVQCKKRRRKHKRQAAARRTSIWETASLNRTWEIPDEIKLQLPLVATEKSDGVPARDTFLEWSGLCLPPPPSAVRHHHHYNQDGGHDLTNQSHVATRSAEAHTLSESQRNSYFGATGAASMKAIYSKLASQRYLQTGGTDGLVDKFKSMLASQSEPSPDAIGSLNSNEAFTARHKFLSLCLDHELPPCLRLIIRSKVSPEINVSHMSMGDQLVQVFCECLLELPMVLSLNLRNNRLTDVGIPAVVRVVAKKHDLCYLDLSENKVDGEGSSALASYMATPSCGLSTLILSHCDIDDGEVVAFAKALCTNRTCHTLDLSRNIIGSNEALNVVQPDLVTGGEALAEMLATNGHLTVLNLSWNFLRLNSAVELGRALAQNNTLKELNLSYNAFGNDGAQAIGCALQRNICVESLDMSHNNIPSKAAFVIAQSLHHNDTLTSLAMDGNPLGRIGGATLLQAISTAYNKTLNISLLGCNFDIDDSSGFDPTNATGSYDLNMDVPYERAIALELLRLANTQKGCKFLSFNHILDKTTHAIPVEKREVNKARAKLVTRRATHAVLRGRMAPDKLDTLFKELDADGSGSIEASELHKGMHAQGLHLSLNEAKQMVGRYDLDGTGTIEFPEFLDLMSQYYFDDKPVTEWVDTSTGMPLEVPTSGRLKCEFLDLHIPSEADETVSKAGVQLLIENIAKDPNQIELIQLAKQNMHLRQSEAQLLLDTMVTKMDIVDALVMLLPQVVDANHACPLIELNTTPAQRLRLQAHLREMFGPIVGMATGHYSLDLGDDHDRASFKKIMELNNKLMYYRRTKNLKDTSQHENYMCFRNELYNNKPMVMTPSFYDTLPNYGSLDFDFVQFSRPMPDILPMSDNRFKQLVAKLYLDRMELAVPLSFRRAPTPAVRTLNPKVYDELIDLQRFRTRIPELYNRDIATPIEFTPPKEQHDITPERVKYSGRRLLLELQALFCSRWITTRQALYVLAKWPLAFGTTKVDAALMLFDRILDLYNYSQVFTALVDSEVAQLIFRLGWLNLWSPLIPEMYYGNFPHTAFIGILPHSRSGQSST
ncbi:hypothetical protein, variant 2 [Aphanomyces astaci]|uniref:hydroxymethylglutaryl-CoA reductase (NADPH) n=1 Tax=Aphanomyces astaci TaxID=112090 RepID=W4FJD7_APHAT|nr:hypothetical protein, variant 2 [Aphanomyces astaci]ETV66959.1 hypothetical protein, variant 2 [Aphanomyces astaci]|eukprot:XP_009843598.1 hypothetical protein, variant 2 [Aphanomyces astaci]